jgi:hypothetical protein
VRVGAARGHRRTSGNFAETRTLSGHVSSQEDDMGRGLLLWLIGIPIPIILIIWVLGGLHG